MSHPESEAAVDVVLGFAKRYMSKPTKIARWRSEMIQLVDREMEKCYNRGYDAGLESGRGYDNEF